MRTIASLVETIGKSYRVFPELPDGAIVPVYQSQVIGPMDAITPVATILLSCVAAGMAILAARRLRETSLVAPAIWGATAMFSVATAEGLALVLADATPTGWIQVVRYAAAVSLVTPAVAELGAKRPQDRGWQFVVASLWAILLSPAIHWLLSRSGDQLAIAPAWSGFLAVLIVFPAIGYLPTRHGWSAVLWLAAQAAILDGLLPHGDLLPSSARGPLGAALACAAMALIFLRSHQARHYQSDIERTWIDFRDAFGAVWAIRVLQRVNAEARMYGWNWRMQWDGLAGQSGPTIPPQVDHDSPSRDLVAIRHTLRSTLRRFVSKKWLDERLENAADASQSG
jgi:hypothetical protein